MRNVTETVKQLIIINILFFIGTLLVSSPAYQYLALFFPENPDFKAWQPITYMFMHGGFMHIFFNMFALYSFVRWWPVLGALCPWRQDRHDFQPEWR